MARRSVQVMITGRVQGVGYRAWVEREASRRRLDGWVRNRADGSVEAMFSGPADVIEAMVEACRAGPRSAVVMQVDSRDVLTPPTPGFRVMSTE
jgi:acylphosphatase